MTESSVFEFP